MDKLYQDLDLRSRLEQIKAEAVGVEVMEYEKPLTDEEVTSFKEELVDISLRIHDLELKKKQFIEDHNAKVKPQANRQKLVLTNLKHKTMTAEGQVYKVPDHEKNVIYFVDGEGYIINMRNMLPDERQLNMNVTFLNKASNE